MNIITPQKVEFKPESATGILHLDKEQTQVHPKICAKNDELYKFLETPEMHVTAITFEIGRQIKSAIRDLGGDEYGTRRLLMWLDQLYKSIDWKIGLQDEYYHVQKFYPYREQYKEFPAIAPEIRRSIIQKVDVQGIDALYYRINQLLGLSLNPPFTHITWFADSTSEDVEEKTAGIAISSPQAFKETHHYPL